MRYIEKDLGPPEVDPDAENKARLAHLPGFAVDFLVRRMYRGIRNGMGGESRDISRRSIHIEDRTIEGYRDPVRIRVYRPEGPGPRPLVMFHHGGGWFGGTVEAVEDFCRGVSDRADCVVVSVDYHLAPEHKYPAGVEDSYKALQWAVTNADELDIAPGRITVAGDSAGGNLSAALAIMANDRGDVAINRQVLIYPATDNRPAQLKRTSPRMHKAMAAVMGLYLEDKSLASHPHVSPITYRDLGALPETLIAVGELDDLLPSSRAFADALDAAGVGVEFILYKNANHAFIDNVGNNANADDLVEETARFITSQR